MQSTPRCAASSAMRCTSPPATAAPLPAMPYASPNCTVPRASFIVAAPQAGGSREHAGARQEFADAVHGEEVRVRARAVLEVLVDRPALFARRARRVIRVNVERDRGLDGEVLVEFERQVRVVARAHD